MWSNNIAAFAGSSTEALGAAIVNVSTNYHFQSHGCESDGVKSTREI